MKSAEGEPTQRQKFFDSDCVKAKQAESAKGEPTQRWIFLYPAFMSQKLIKPLLGQGNLFFSVRYTCCSLQSLPTYFSYRVMAIEPAKDFRYHQGHGEYYRSMQDEG